MNSIIKDLTVRHSELAPLENIIDLAAQMIVSCYKSGGRLLICGNGGSAADSSHIVGELMKSFKFKRPISAEISERLVALGDDGEFLANTLEGALPAIALTESTSLSTAFSNDADASATYAQQILGLGRAGDVLVTLTTSGNSRNCVLAAIAARALGMKVIALTGFDGGRVKEYADILINVPERETYLVQELHLPVYHTICASVEKEMFS